MGETAVKKPRGERLSDWRDVALIAAWVVLWVRVHPTASRAVGAVAKLFEGWSCAFAEDGAAAEERGSLVVGAAGPLLESIADCLERRASEARITGLRPTTEGEIWCLQAAASAARAMRCALHVEYRQANLFLDLSFRQLAIGLEVKESDVERLWLLAIEPPRLDLTPLAAPAAQAIDRLMADLRGDFAVVDVQANAVVGRYASEATAAERAAHYPDRLLMVHVSRLASMGLRSGSLAAGGAR